MGSKAPIIAQIGFVREQKGQGVLKLSLFKLLESKLDLFAPGYLSSEMANLSTKMAYFSYNWALMNTDWTNLWPILTNLITREAHLNTIGAQLLLLEP